MKKSGRPSKYNDDILKKTKKYIANHLSCGDPVPLVAGLACELGISRERIYKWVKDDDKIELRDLIDEMMAKQERLLVGGSLNDDYNASISRLILSKHGYSEKQEIKQHVTGEQVIKVEYE